MRPPWPYDTREPRMAIHEGIIVGLAEELR
jgi:hypothetical protein